MGIYGIGVDIVHIPRILRILSKSPSHASAFARRILSPRELPDWGHLISDPNNHDQAERARYLAVKWAAKEAIYKASYPRHKPTWHTVWIDKSGGEKPHIHLLRGQDAGIGKTHLSIAHDGDYVIAQVILEELDDRY